MVICKYNCFARAHVHLSDYNFYSNFLTILDQHFSTDCKCKSPPLKSLSMSTCCAVGQKASSCANIKKKCILAKTSKIKSVWCILSFEEFH